MKYTIHGFSQLVAMELKLDDRDLMILRWFVDYKDTGKMVKKIIDEDMYYWIKYEGIQESFPIVGWKKDTIYRRLKKLALAGVLKHKTVKQMGTYSFYAIGDNYLALTDTTGEITIGNKSYSSKASNNNLSDINPIGTDNNPKASEKNPIGTDNNPNETDLNPEQNINQLNSSIKHSSINNNVIDFPTKENEIISYLNKKGFSNISTIVSDMKMLLENHSLEDIKEAIDITVAKDIHSDKYVLTILGGWRKHGKPKDKKAEKEQKFENMFNF